MKQYKSHKIVRAAAVQLIETRREEVPEGVVGDVIGFNVHLSTGDVTHVGMDIFARGFAQPGDYLVMYPDGYVSWSPKKVFEEGYEEYLPANEEAQKFASAGAGVRLQCIAMANGNNKHTSVTEVLKAADDYYRFIRGDEIKFENAPPVGIVPREAVEDAMAQINDLCEEATTLLEGSGTKEDVARRMFAIVQTSADLAAYLRR